MIYTIITFLFLIVYFGTVYLITDIIVTKQDPDGRRKEWNKYIRSLPEEKYKNYERFLIEYN